MKITVQHYNIRSTDKLDSYIEEKILALQPDLQIDEANVRVEWLRGSSPAYCTRVHLVTPGPDVVAEGRDHTILAAIGKVMAELRSRIDGRHEKRRRRVRSNLQKPALSRMGRGRL